jgi:hypothetical protein
MNGFNSCVLLEYGILIKTGSLCHIIRHDSSEKYSLGVRISPGETSLRDEVKRWQVAEGKMSRSANGTVVPQEFRYNSSRNLLISSNHGNYSERR